MSAAQLNQELLGTSLRWVGKLETRIKLGFAASENNILGSIEPFKGPHQHARPYIYWHAAANH